MSVESVSPSAICLKVAIQRGEKRLSSSGVYELTRSSGIHLEASPPCAVEPSLGTVKEYGFGDYWIQAVQWQQETRRVCEAQTTSISEPPPQLDPLGSCTQQFNENISIYRVCKVHLSSCPTP